MKAAIFFHCLFYYGIPPSLLTQSLAIVHEQISALRDSGLLDVCEHFVVGCNGGDESRAVVAAMIPSKARVIMHGLESRGENLTIMEIEKWAPAHPNWAILYFHTKGVTHQPGSDHHKFVTKWRRGMMEDLVVNWKRCLDDLMLCDIACSLWLSNMADGTQHIPAGNFLWVKSNFVAKLPSMMDRARIKMSGIESVESRFESEVYWGNGPRPRVKQYHPQWQVWRNIL